MAFRLPKELKNLKSGDSVCYVIGDLHGEIGIIKWLLKNVVQKDLEKGIKSEIIQVGDYGFKGDYIKTSRFPLVNSNFHLVGGNHDDYDYLDSNELPFYLGDYGVIPKTDIFFIRGAASHDKKDRLTGYFGKNAGKVWWEQEEINKDKFSEIEELYLSLKPQVVITHCGPNVINGMFLDPSITTNFLQKLWELHSPQLWIMGHYHTNFSVLIDETKFVVLEQKQIFPIIVSQ